MADKRIVLCFLLCMVSEAQNCSMDLMNTVVNEGDESAFNNTDDGQPVKWQFIPSSDALNRILDITDDDNKVKKKFEGVYSVSSTALTIIKATIKPEGSNNYSTAGLYFLTYNSSGCETAANFIVLRKEECTGNDDRTQLKCSVSYAESNVQPSSPTMAYTSSTDAVNGRNVQPTTKTKGYVQESEDRISFSNDDFFENICRVTFKKPPDGPYHFVARNAPSFYIQCFTFIDENSSPPGTGNDATTTEVTTPPTAYTDATTTGEGQTSQSPDENSSPPGTGNDATTTGEGQTSQSPGNQTTCTSRWLQNLKELCKQVDESSDDCLEQAIPVEVIEL